MPENVQRLLMLEFAMTMARQGYDDEQWVHEVMFHDATLVWC